MTQRESAELEPCYNFGMMPPATALKLLALVFVLVTIPCGLLQRAAERRPPAHRRELEAAYAAFHRFLSAVRCAALRAVE